MKLLHLDSGIHGDRSVSRRLSRAVVDRLTDADVAVDVTYRDLVETPVPHLTGPTFAAQGGDDEPRDDDVALGRRLLGEFLAADTIVIGVAFYNFGVPSQLKAWVDRIAVAGRTFRYTETGPEGLAGGKRVILAISRGGSYGPGSGAEAFEHAESYLKALFGFLGVTRIDVVAAEGVAAGPENRERAIERALAQAAALDA